jgi:hypothetical protein
MERRELGGLGRRPGSLRELVQSLFQPTDFLAIASEITRS